MSVASFPKSAHLRKKNDFERVYLQKCKAADGVLLVFLAHNGLGVCRLGVSVSNNQLIHNNLHINMSAIQHLNTPSKYCLIWVSVSIKMATHKIN